MCICISLSIYIYPIGFMSLCLWRTLTNTYVYGEEKGSYCQKTDGKEQSVGEVLY